MTKYCCHCHTRPVWRHSKNDIGACKRCYHEVWARTRRRICELHAAMAALERGYIPEPLKTYGKTPEGVAQALLEELEHDAWQTGAKHELPVLLQRCQRLATQQRREFL